MDRQITMSNNMMVEKRISALPSGSAERIKNVWLWFIQVGSQIRFWEETCSHVRGCMGQFARLRWRSAPVEGNRCTKNREEKGDANQDGRLPSGYPILVIFI